MATALVHGATAFVTNDRRLRPLMPLLEIFILDDFAVGQGGEGGCSDAADG
jgi:hypothetical protein